MKKILLMPTLLATTVAPISFLTTLTNCGKAANITFESNNILYLEDVQNKANEDYVGKITLNEEFKGKYDIPQTNCYYEVKVGDKVIDNYDVDQVGDQNNYYATITIPKDELKDNNHVTITAKECPHYLCFEAIDEGATVGYEIKGNIDVQIQICEDINTPSPEWVNWDGTKITLVKGKKMYVKNIKDKLSVDYSNNLNFNTNEILKKVSIIGNIMSMINYGNLSEFCFYKLFFNMPLYNNVPILPAITLAKNCYFNIFSGAHYLVVSPELPAMKLAESCYDSMFCDCYSLSSAPELPAMELAESCYDNMFCDCYRLQFTPELPATDLKPYCYQWMFDCCYSLTVAPELPSIKLAEDCYHYMFSDCYSLIIAPNLPAKTLPAGCYYGMFDGCLSLRVSDKNGTKKIFERSNSTDYCVSSMFSGCICDFEGDPKIGTTYYCL